MPDPLMNVPSFRGGAVTGALAAQEERDKRTEKEKFLADISAAGSRARALDVVKNYSGKFRIPQDFTTAFRVVDEFYPEASKEVRQVTVYDEDTGAPTTTFMPSAEAVGLTPETVKQRFGPKATLTKPEVETFYSKPGEKGETRVLGRFPIERRPEGAVTLQELSEERRFRGEQLAKRRIELSEDRLELMERRMEEALKGDKTKASQGRLLINDATRLTAISLNATMLPDGSWSFSDDNRAKIFKNRLDYMLNLLEGNPAILDKPQGGLFLFQDAAKLYPLSSEAPSPEPKPEPKKEEPGLLSKGAAAVKRAVTGEPAKPATEGDIGAQISAKAKEISARTDLKPEQKKAALDKLREIAKKNKVKVGF